MILSPNVREFQHDQADLCKMFYKIMYLCSKTRRLLLVGVSVEFFMQVLKLIVIFDQQPRVVDEWSYLRCPDRFQDALV